MGTIYRLVILAVLVGALALPAGASAQSCEAPPGTGAVDQYCETIPRADGETGASQPGSTRSRQPLPAATQRALRTGGSDAQALGELLEGPAGERPQGGATADDRGGADRRDAGEGRGGPEFSPEGEPSSNPFSALTASIGQGDETVGGAFVWILLGLALLVLSLAWLRFRRRDATPD